MGFLTGKKILIIGIYNKKSIAYGIAKSMKKQGAKLAFTYQKKKNKNKIKKYLKKFNPKIILHCDVKKNKNIKILVQKISKIWKKIDGLVHAIAYTQYQKYTKKYTNLITKKNFFITQNISCFSFLNIAQKIKHLLSNKSCLLTLTYIGSNKVVPNYKIMGIAKASLETSIKYMAYELGYKGIRVNAISCGIIPTISSKAIKNFNKILRYSTLLNPIKKKITNKDIGNTAAFLCSDLSSAITGEIIYVDGGLHIMTAINKK